MIRRWRSRSALLACALGGIATAHAASAPADVAAQAVPSPAAAVSAEASARSTAPPIVAPADRAATPTGSAATTPAAKTAPGGAPGTPATAAADTPPSTPPSADVVVPAEGSAQAATQEEPASGTPLSAAVTRGDEVFARIRRNLAGNACIAGGNTERWRRRYAANPAALAKRIEHILPLLDFVSAEVERARLPSEFVFIPLVESWYKPEAIGANGPAGMWQMIGSTARNHGIHIVPGYDGRLSPVESTRAALSYLKTLQGMFGNWQATVMAYNAGEGRLKGAYKKARSREANGEGRRPHGLSNITYDYVGKLQALSCLVTQPERHGLKLPRGSRFTPLAAVTMDGRITSIEQFATQRGRNANELRRLNPGYTGGRVVAGVPRLLLMPLAAPQGDIIRLEAPPAGLADADADANAATAAALAATAIAEAQAADAGAPAGPATAAGANTLDATDAVATGVLAGAPSASPSSSPGTSPSTAGAKVDVTLPTASVAASASQPAGTGTATAAPTHRVVAGDSLSTIAAAHGVSVQQLRKLNAIPRGDVLRPGDLLRIAP